eukprot:c16855_g1_i1 orf=464-1312(-)
MEVQEFSQQERRYIEELVPMLRRIHRQPAYSCSLTKRERAQVVRFAADICLVKAAGGTAKWCEALHKTLINTDNATRFIHRRNITTQVDIEVCARKNSRRSRSAASVADARTYYKFWGARRTHGNSWPQACTYDRNRGARISGNNISPYYKYRGARIHVTNMPRYWGARTRRGNKTPNASITLYRKFHGAHTHGTNRSHGRIHKTHAKPIIIANALARTSSDDHIFEMAGQIEDLQHLIPGGTSLIDPASLLEETALYILALQMQVHSLHTLAYAPHHTTTL